jgi:hypothetical protein
MPTQHPIIIEDRKTPEGIWLPYAKIENTYHTNANTAVVK